MTVRRSRAASAALLLAAVAALPLLGAAPAGANPLKGNGSWIWELSSSGGSPRAVARKAKHERLDTVYVKSADGANPWSQFSSKLVHALHKRGIKACAWPFVYGDDPGREAKASARAAELGADCIVIDAEASYEGRYKQAYTYIHKLRKLVGPRYPLGLSSFPYTDYHPSFPYSVFLGNDGASFNVPQVYWSAIGTSVRRAFEHTYRFNQLYGRPIFPVGQTYEDPGKRELLDFRRYAREYRARGISWYSWQETAPSEWKIVRRKGVKGVPGYEAESGIAKLERGDRGDAVVYAQELLAAAGRQTAPSGVFDARTGRAVRHFQQDEELRATGRIGTATWEALLTNEPLSTNWKRTHVPKALRRAPVAQRARSELPAGIGSGHG